MFVFSTRKKSINILSIINILTSIKCSKHFPQFPYNYSTKVVESCSFLRTSFLPFLNFCIKLSSFCLIFVRRTPLGAELSDWQSQHTGHRTTTTSKDPLNSHTVASGGVGNRTECSISTTHCRHPRDCWRTRATARICIPARRRPTEEPRRRSSTPAAVAARSCWGCATVSWPSAGHSRTRLIAINRRRRRSRSRRSRRSRRTWN